MIGHWLHSVGQVALTWPPLVFLGFVIYLLWRTVQLMPRVPARRPRAPSLRSCSRARPTGSSLPARASG